MPFGPGGNTGSNIGSLGNAFDAPETATDSRVNPNRFTLPDFLRPWTVTQFAPFTYSQFSLSGAADIQVLAANPARVGLLFVAGGVFVGNLLLAPQTMPAPFSLFALAAGDSAVGLLINLLSLITDAWVARAGVACDLLVCEFARGC